MNTYGPCRDDVAELFDRIDVKDLIRRTTLEKTDICGILGLLYHFITSNPDPFQLMTLHGEDFVDEVESLSESWVEHAHPELGDDLFDEMFEEAYTVIDYVLWENLQILLSGWGYRL